MSEVQPLVSTGPSTGVRAAIGRAAQRTGVDFDYLLAQARLESGLDPAARARSSSAAGLYQFVNRTWLATLDRHGEAHGLGWAGTAIDEGRVRDPALRAQIMALRFDPETAAAMAGELARDNAAALRNATGREPGPVDLYLAHFLGADGAVRLLAAEAQDPAGPAAALLPQAAAANRAIFYAPGGAARSLGEVHALISAKFAAAVARDGGALPEAAGPAPIAAPEGWAAARGPVARELAAARQALPPSARGSMAETLRASFGLDARALDGAASGAPEHVRAAYGRFRGLGL